MSFLMTLFLKSRFSSLFEIIFAQKKYFLLSPPSLNNYYNSNLKLVKILLASDDWKV